MAREVLIKIQQNDDELTDIVKEYERSQQSKIGKVKLTYIEIEVVENTLWLLTCTVASNRRFCMSEV